MKRKITSKITYSNKVSVGRGGAGAGREEWTERKRCGKTIISPLEKENLFSGIVWQNLSRARFLNPRAAARPKFGEVERRVRRTLGN